MNENTCEESGASVTSNAAEVRIRASVLADGREIIYFDDSPGEQRQRLVADSRTLAPTDPHPEMRQDPLTGRWIAYAAHRMNRTFMPPAAENPLAPTVSGQSPTEIPAPDYDVVVFENRFPSFAQNATLSADVVALGLPPLDIPRRPAIARCEVVCFTSDAQASFKDLSPQRVRTVITAWAQRTSALLALEEVQAVFPFENRGEEIGVTLQHPHGQIYAYPFIPPRLQSIVDSAKNYQAEHSGDLFKALLEHERATQQRMVMEGEYFSVFVPPAAKWPLEIMVLPHRAVATFADLTEPEIVELADLYLDILQRVDRFYPGVEKTPYIAAWYQAPKGSAPHEMRLHLSLFSLMRAPQRMKYLAGSEAAMEVWINDTTPEIIAARLREVGAP